LGSQLDDEYAPVKMVSILCLETRRNKNQKSENQLIVNIDKNVNVHDIRLVRLVMK